MMPISSSDDPVTTASFHQDDPSFWPEIDRVKASHDVWEKKGVAAGWHHVMVNNPFLSELVDSQVPFIRSVLESMRRTSHPSGDEALKTPLSDDQVGRGKILLDVGCGPGSLICELMTAVPSLALCGTDISDDALAKCRKRMADIVAAATAEAKPPHTLPSLLCGDATHLRSSITDHAAFKRACFGGEVNTSGPQTDGINFPIFLEAVCPPRIVCSMFNTVGILPESIRAQVLSEMFLSVRPHVDRVMFLFFDAGKLEEGFERLYSCSPFLTGVPATREHIDFEKGRLHIPESGYTSQWFTPKRALKLFDDAEAIAFGCDQCPHHHLASDPHAAYDHFNDETSHFYWQFTRVPPHGLYVVGVRKTIEQCTCEAKTSQNSSLHSTPQK